MKKRGVLKEIIITFLMLLLVFAIFELIFYVNTGREFFASLSRPEMVVVPFLLQNLLYVVLGFAGLFLIIFFVSPLLAFLFSKCKCYFILWYTSLRQHCKFKICRIPFASLLGVKEQPDIKIGMADKTLYIHFIDVPRNFRRGLTLMSSREYCITKVEPEKIQNEDSGNRGLVNPAYSVTHLFMGAKSKNDKALSSPSPSSAPPDSASYFSGLRLTKDKIKPIPEFPSSPSEYHVLLVAPGYIKARVASGYDKLDSGSEIWVGSIMACSAKTLKKRLRGELRTPFQPQQQKEF